MNGIIVWIEKMFSVFSVVLAIALVGSHASAAESPKEKIAFAYAAISPTMAGVWMAKGWAPYEKLYKGAKP